MPAIQQVVSHNANETPFTQNSVKQHQQIFYEDSDGDDYERPQTEYTERL